MTPNAKSLLKRMRAFDLAINASKKIIASHIKNPNKTKEFWDDMFDEVLKVATKAMEGNDDYKE